MGSRVNLCFIACLHVSDCDPKCFKRVALGV